MSTNKSRLTVEELEDELISANAYLDMLYARPMEVWADWLERHDTIGEATRKVGVLNWELKKLKGKQL